MQSIFGPELTDHRTSNAITTFTNGIGQMALWSDDHTKIIFSSRGLHLGLSRHLG